MKKLLMVILLAMLVVPVMGQDINLGKDVETSDVSLEDIKDITGQTVTVERTNALIEVARKLDTQVKQLVEHIKSLDSIIAERDAALKQSQILFFNEKRKYDKLLTDLKEAQAKRKK